MFSCGSPFTTTSARLGKIFTKVGVVDTSDMSDSKTFLPSLVCKVSVGVHKFVSTPDDNYTVPWTFVHRDVLESSLGLNRSVPGPRRRDDETVDVTGVERRHVGKGRESDV